MKGGRCRDLEDCHEGSERFPVCRVGKEIELELVDSIDCQEGNRSILNCQVGRDENAGLAESLMDSKVSSIQQGVLMKMGSVDLIVCQEGNGIIPHCQVGRDEQMRLSVGLINPEMNLDQQVQLTKEEDQDDILMIGGSGVFLPCAQEEAEIGVADGAAAEQSQQMMTVKEELEQTLEAAQAKEENEHFEECLNIFSQEVERAVALELAAKEAKE
jgi:hypothetical protein